MKIQDIDIIGSDECYENFLVMNCFSDKRVLELISHEHLVNLVVKSDYPFPPFALLDYLGIPNSLSDILTVHHNDIAD